MMIMIGIVEPFSKSADTRSRIYDEFFAFLILYHLICATSFVNDNQARARVGWSMIITTITILIVRIGGIFIQALEAPKEAFRVYWLKRQTKIKIQKIL
jgi:hypothetical protein